MIIGMFLQKIPTAQTVTVIVTVLPVIMQSKFTSWLAWKSITSGDTQPLEELYSALTSHRLEVRVILESHFDCTIKLRSGMLTVTGKFGAHFPEWPWGSAPIYNVSPLHSRHQPGMDRAQHR